MRGAPTSAIESVLAADGIDVVVMPTVKDAIVRGAALDADAIVLGGTTDRARLDIDAAACVRSLRARLAVPIALIAPPHDGTRARTATLDAGADDVIELPLRPTELVARVRLLVRLRRTLAELDAVASRVTELSAEVEQIAVRDGTGAYDARWLELKSGEAIERARRYGQPLSVIRVRIAVGSVHGDADGDESALRRAALAVQKALRSTDLVARLENGELAILAPGADERGSGVLAERVRSIACVAVAQTRGSRVAREVVTVGVATILGRDGPMLPAPRELLEMAAPSDMGAEVVDLPTAKSSPRLRARASSVPACRKSS